MWTIWHLLAVEFADEAFLISLFGEGGTATKAKSFPNRISQKLPGVGLVTMSSVEEATWCVNNLCGRKLQGGDEPLLVKFALTHGGAQLTCPPCFHSVRAMQGSKIGVAATCVAPGGKGAPSGNRNLDASLSLLMSPDVLVLLSDMLVVLLSCHDVASI